MEQGGEINTQSVMEQLAEAFLELEASKEAFECKIEWVEIEKHFRNLEATWKKKLEEFEAKEREYEEEESRMHKLLAERQAAVASKEQDLSDRVQDLKDAAIATIAEARANHQTIAFENVDDGENKYNKVSSSLGDTAFPEEDFPPKSGKNYDGVAIEFRPRPELTHFCEQMDAKSLLTFIMENENNLSVIREEMSVALESATEPARLVLDSLEGFYPINDTAELKDNMDAALPGMHRSCTIIMEALGNLFASADSGADRFLNPEFKQQAKAIADEWRPKLASANIDAANGNSFEAVAYLQLLSTFRIASEFDEEELCKLVIAVARCKQAPELCRSIGLTHKVPAIVELLIKDGKPIAAIDFIHAFQLEESFPTVHLLKEYLKNIRRNSQVKAGIADDVNDANTRELAALKTVINRIKEYKLESDYPLDSLQKRVGQLEKSKSTDRKVSGEFNKRPQSKKPRTSAGYFSSRSSGGRAASSGVIGRQRPPVRAAYSGVQNRYRGQVIHTQPPNTALPNQGHYVGSSLQSSDRPYL
ncbi:unnamed protein product [Lupinus luteus]|uniref:FRIGIDA-like protein n=1 Tax=Lupinus luteus TaxID=3873 RepID=A0AAV1WYK4_LUPLU